MKTMLQQLSRGLIAIAALSLLWGCPKRPEAADADVSSGGGETKPRFAEPAKPTGDAPKGPVSANEQASQAFLRAVETYKTSKGDPGAAIDKFEEAAREDPKLGIAWFNAGVLEEQRGNEKRAEELYHKAIAADPKLDEPAENLGVMMLRRGDTGGARRAFDTAVRKNPAAVGSRLRLARFALRDNNVKKAYDLAKEALGHDAKSLEAYRILAEVALKQNLPSMAKLLILKGYKLREDDPYLHFISAEILFAEKERAAAVAEYRKVLQTDPGFGPARVRLAAIALELRDFGTAERQFAEIARADPKNVNALVNRAIALKGQAKFTDAKAVYEQVLKVKQTQPEALFGLGVLELRHLNDPKSARERFRKFLSVKSVPGKHKVFEMQQECDTLIRAKEEEKRMMEVQKKQQAEMERRAAEEKKRQAASGSKPASAPAKPEGEEGEEGEEGAAPAAKQPDKAPAAPAKPPEEEEQEEEAEPAPAAPAPAPAPPPDDEPEPDEPTE